MARQGCQRLRGGGRGPRFASKFLDPPGNGVVEAGRMAWEPGMKVVHRAQRGWGVGIVIQVGDDGRRLAVRFAGREGVTVVSGRDPALTAVPSVSGIPFTRR